MLTSFGHLGENVSGLATKINIMLINMLYEHITSFISLSCSFIEKVGEIWPLSMDWNFVSGVKEYATLL